jgi:hypothetical protein
MRFSEQDIRPDVPRPLSHCGDQPGRDARWRWYGDAPLGRGDTIAIRNLQRMVERSNA